MFQERGKWEARSSRRFVLITVNEHISTTDFLLSLKTVPVQQFTKGIAESKFSDHLKVKERKQRGKFFFQVYRSS